MIQFCHISVQKIRPLILFQISKSNRYRILLLGYTGDFGPRSLYTVEF